MSQIRRQSIISSVMVYIGFALGFLNTYLFTKEGGFSQEEYGLVGIFVAVASLMFAVANFGMPSYIGKFFPYYKSNLQQAQNDMLTWAIVVAAFGFLLVMAGGIYFKDLIILKFGKNSPLLVKYYYWIFPLGFGLTLFSVLEAFAWQLRRAVITNYLREIQFRLFTTLLIVLSFAAVITSFDVFIKIYAFTYIATALILLLYLFSKKEINFTFTASLVTRKYYKKILSLISFVFGGTLIYGISLIFDSLVIASVMPDGLADVAVFSLGQYMASIVQAPQRGIIASSIGPLSQAWKDKDMGRILKIYRQSSINQLIFAAGMFTLIWLNFTDGIFTFNLQKGYLDAKWVFFFVGLYRIMDMGTGVNAQIIATSTLWRFEFYTGTILLALTLPLTYFLTKSSLGIIGPPVATLIAFFVYNSIRYWLLLKRYKLQPFTIKTLYTLLLAIVVYFICWLLFRHQQGFWWMVLRSSTFLILYIYGVVTLRLSSDLQPVWQTFLKKTGIKKGLQ
ncbi:MAG TPA: MATE family efflux transporter [Ferruginibacter sp.]|nr:MATE family efflux transporter [Ferruginibacter sp.]HMP21190.1 MATE family efflux transporter [Ferruginibacter sp.]